MTPTQCLARLLRPIHLTLLLMLLCGPLAAQPQAGASGSHTLNLQDVDIDTLVSTVADITGRSFIIDPRVTGQVTVISSTPMGPDEIYSTFLSVLEVHGLAAVADNGVTRIVPGLQAMKSGAGGTARQDLVTKVVPVSHVSVDELLPLLRPLVPAEASLVAHAGSNTLLITDRLANVQRLERVIARIDRSADQEVDSMRLEHASASEMARTLGQLYPGARMIADERTNTLLLSGDEQRRLRLRTLVSHLDTPPESGGDSRVIYLNYANAASLVPVLQQSVVVPGTEGEAAAAGISIQAHEETNSLVINAPPSVLRSLQDVIRQLDIRRHQVLVEAVIAEVSMQTMQELGIQWQFYGAFDDNGEGVFGGTNFGSGGDNILNLATGLGGDNPVQPSNGLNLGYISGITEILGTEVLEIGALLRALSSDADSNVLSTPSIVSLDNAEAEIYVGQEVPFITGQFTNTGLSDQQGTVNPFQTIERDEVGIRLAVTPHINEGDAVVLDISQEISSIAPVVGAVDLITNKRTLKTTVMVPDNAILVLGGLITEDLQESLDRVPGLSNIPGIGELFKSRSTQRVKRNLMLFIRPRILRDAATEQQLTHGKYNYIRTEQLNARERDIGLTPADQMPLLPELNDYLQAPLMPAEPPPDAFPDSGEGGREP